MKEIKLTQGKVALVDDADFEWLNSVKWRAHRCCKTFYAVRDCRSTSGRCHRVRMHQLLAAVMGFSRPDHSDCNGLNNQRNNLRPATPQQQMMNRRRPVNNTSGFVGVRWHKQNRNWNAQIQKNGLLKHLGCFKTAIEAARAYDQAALELFGEFARLNFPTEHINTIKLKTYG